MNEREIAELRRRMRPEKNTIGRIRGCYVNESKCIISEFDQNLGLISNDEAEEILSLFRKTFSGGLGRNLVDISFSNEQVLSGDEHRLLMALRDSSLGDDASVKKLFQKVAESTDIEGSFFVLLANDKYDVFTKNEFGEKNESPDVFSYIVCAVCPVKSAKPTLGYLINENRFKNILRDSIVSAPEIGFVFPAYESGVANIYQAMMFTRDISLAHEEFVNSIFRVSTPKPASEQTESIAGLIASSVTEEECSLEMIQTIQAQLIELTADHKANKETEPLMISTKDMGTLLRCGGVGEESIKAFSERFEEDFGVLAAIPPANIMDIKKLEVKTPEVTVKVSPECGQFVQTRIIDGTKYLLIRADGDIEVNGIRINIKD